LPERFEHLENDADVGEDKITKKSVEQIENLWKS
jgi:hypothetical protein